MTGAPTLEDIRDRVAAHRPSLVGRDRDIWAATALVVAPHHDGPAIAFMQRTRRPGDRWSGQMALPGGRRDPTDPDLAATAVRESREEVGLDLTQPPVGRLDDRRTQLSRAAVATFVFLLDQPQPLTPDGHEAEAALWIPMAALFRPDAAFRYRYGRLGRFPAIRHGDHVIWGLTHRILGSFGSLLDLELPSP